MGKKSSRSAAAGFEQLDRLGWIKEGQANYLSQAAADYTRRVLVGQDVLGLAPTWAENHAMTSEVRAGLRAAGKLGTETTLSVHEPTQWTRAQRADAGLYQTGMVVTFRQHGAGGKRGQSVPVAAVEGGQVRLADGAALALNKADRFDVARPRELAVAVGDKLLMRANSPDKQLVNGAVLTVAKGDGNLTVAKGMVKRDVLGCFPRPSSTSARDAAARSSVRTATPRMGHSGPSAWSVDARLSCSPRGRATTRGSRTR